MKSLLLFICISVSLQSLSQNWDQFLAIDPVHGVKREKIYIGDPMKLKLKSGEKVFGELIMIRDSSIQLGADSIAVSDITKVYLLDRRFGWSLLKRVSLRAGLGYFVIDTGNRLLNDDDPIVPRATWQISTGFLGLAAIASLLDQKVIRIKDINQIKIIDLRMN